MLSFVFLATLAAHVLAQASVSYPKDECDWIGADGMHGAYLPIGVCKHIYNPYNLSTPVDDHYYSHMYVCDANGVVTQRAWGHNSFCQGDYSEMAVRTSGGDYYYCSGNGPCPYAVVRFYHQLTPESNQCIKSTDGWFSEAPMTTYQCLNITKDGVNEWYMFKCTQNGALIGYDYTENCQEVLNETIFNDGCSYKDLFVEMEHCDYWDEASPFLRSTTTTTTSSTTTTTTTTTTTNAPVVPTDSTQSVAVDSESDSDGYNQHNHRGHSGSHSHDGDRGHYDGEAQRVEGWTEGLELWLLIGVLCVVVVVSCAVLGCCMNIRRKREIEAFARIVEYTMDIEGGDDVNERDNAVIVEGGETVTFK